MSKTILHQLLIAAVTAVIFFTNLGGSHLWDDDEARHGAVALAMYDRGDAIVPMFNGQISTDKPILMFWCMLLGMKIFGAAEFGIRCYAAVFAVGTALCTYHLGRILFRPIVGLWAGLIMATTFYFGFTCRAATPDSPLVFFTTLGLTLFVRATFGRNRNVLTDDSPRSIVELLPQRWADWAWMYAAFAIGILAKGPIGLVLPGLVIGIYVLMSADRDGATQPQTLGGSVRGWFKKVFSPRRVATAFWAMRPFTALLWVALLAAPWYVAVGIQTNGEWVTGFFGRHNLNRFIEPMQSHRGPIWYYVPAIFAGMFPWSIFMPLAIWRGMQGVYSSQPTRRITALLLCWFLVYFIFFSFAATKLPNYLLPAFPALAVLIGAWLQKWIDEPACERKFWFRLAFGSLSLVGATTMIGLYFFVERFLPQGRTLVWIGLPPLIGGLAGLVFSELNRQRAAVTATVTAGVAMSVAIFGFAQLKVDETQNSASLIAAVKHEGGDRFELTTYRYLPSSLVFYSRRTVEPAADAVDLAKQLHENPGRYVLVSTIELEKVQAGLPADYVVLAREPRFLRPAEEILLLGRPQKLTNKSLSSDLH